MATILSPNLDQRIRKFCNDQPDKISDLSIISQEGGVHGIIRRRREAELPLRKVLTKNWTQVPALNEDPASTFNSRRAGKWNAQSKLVFSYCIMFEFNCRKFNSKSGKRCPFLESEGNICNTQSLGSGGMFRILRPGLFPAPRIVRCSKLAAYFFRTRSHPGFEPGAGLNSRVER